MATDDSPHANRQRAVWVCVAFAGTLVLAIAAALEPAPAGYGTHLQLGLPPCGFLSLTGLPCPGCGLTTAFAHAVRGELVPAFWANPLGLALFGVVCAGIPVSAVAAVRGWSADAVFARFALGRWALAIAACALVVSAARWMSVL